MRLLPELWCERHLGIFGALGGLLGLSGAGAAGLLTGGLGQYFANRSGRHAAGRQMDFQEYMSNTAWQRGVADMQAAGLNPMLAYHAGPASSPGGSTFVPQNIGAAATHGAAEMEMAGSSAASAERTRQETEPSVRRLDAEVASLYAGVSKTVQETELARMETIIAKWEAVFREMRDPEGVSRFIRQRIAELERSQAGASQGRAEALGAWETLKRLRREGAIDESDFGEMMGYVKRFVDAVGSGLGAAVGGFLGGRFGRGLGVRPGVGPGLRFPRR